MYAVILVVPLVLLFGLGFMAGVETRLDRGGAVADDVDGAIEATTAAESEELDTESRQRGAVAV